MAGSIGFRHTYGVAEYAALTDFACHCLVDMARYHCGLDEFSFHVIGDDHRRIDMTSEVLERAARVVVERASKGGAA